MVKFFAALDAIQPPVAILGALCLGVTVASLLAPGAGASGIAGFVPLILVGLYGLVVLIKGRREGIGCATVIWGPVYLAWRCTTFVLAWTFLDRIHLGRRRKDATEGLDQSTACSAPDGALSQDP